jgi:hypothetical protein
MSISLIIKAAIGRNRGEAHHPAPTHTSMSPEHERRKGEELRNKIGHGKCFVGAQRIC